MPQSNPLCACFAPSCAANPAIPSERPVKESAEDIRAANGRLEPRQRLRVFFLERAAESLGIFLQRFQPDLPVQGGVRSLQATDLRAANIGHDCTSLGLV